MTYRAEQSHLTVQLKDLVGILDYMSSKSQLDIICCVLLFAYFFAGYVFTQTLLVLQEDDLFCFKQKNDAFSNVVNTCAKVCLRAKQHQDTWGMYCSSYPNLFSLQPCVDKIKPHTLC